MRQQRAKHTVAANLRTSSRMATGPRATYSATPLDEIDIGGLSASRFLLRETRRLPYRDAEGHVNLHLCRQSWAQLGASAGSYTTSVEEKLGAWLRHAERWWARSQQLLPLARPGCDGVACDSSPAAAGVAANGEDSEDLDSEEDDKPLSLRSSYRRGAGPGPAAAQSVGARDGRLGGKGRPRYLLSSSDVAAGQGSAATLRPFFLEVKLKSGEGLINPDAGASGSLVGLLLARPDAGEPVRLYVALSPPAQQRKRGAPTCALVRDFAIGGHDGATLESASGRSRLMVQHQLCVPLSERNCLPSACRDWTDRFNAAGVNDRFVYPAAVTVQAAADAMARAAAARALFTVQDRHLVLATSWSPASHSLFPAAARARAALLVVSLYEIHERHHLDSAGNTNGIAARDFSACVLRFAITRETE